MKVKGKTMKRETDGSSATSQTRAPQIIFTHKKRKYTLGTSV